jgi:hypothetical protein
MQTSTSAAKDFNQTIDTWIKELGKYDLTQLLIKPSPTSWSLGQLYIHLLESTRFFIKQIQISTSNNDNINEEAYTDARTMFRNNDFPDALLEGPPSNARTAQPKSKNQLVTELTHLKDEIKNAEALIAKTKYKAKQNILGWVILLPANGCNFRKCISVII